MLKVTLSNECDPRKRLSTLGASTFGGAGAGGGAAVANVGLLIT